MIKRRAVSAGQEPSSFYPLHPLCQFSGELPPDAKIDTIEVAGALEAEPDKNKMVFRFALQCCFQARFPFCAQVSQVVVKFTSRSRGNGTLNVFVKHQTDRGQG